MKQVKVKDFSESDSDLKRFYRLGSLNLLCLRDIIRKLLHSYMEGSFGNLSKSDMECLFRFYNESSVAYVNPNKKSMLHRVGKKTRK